MIQDNDGFNSHDEDAVIIPSGKAPDELLDDDVVIVQGTTFTKEEIVEANKPQPNVILSTTDVNTNPASNYRDTERVNPRSNESPDSTDSNSGGIIAGGVKGVSQS